MPHFADDLRMKRFNSTYSHMGQRRQALPVAMTANLWSKPCNDTVLTSVLTSSAYIFQRCDSA